MKGTGPNRDKRRLGGGDKRCIERGKWTSNRQQSTRLDERRAAQATSTTTSRGRGGRDRERNGHNGGVAGHAASERRSECADVRVGRGDGWDNHCKTSGEMEGESSGQCGTKHGLDGRVGVKSIPPEKVFKETKNSDSSTCVRCNFYDGVSDGNKVRLLFFPSVYFTLCSLTLLILVTNTH